MLPKERIAITLTAHQMRLRLIPSITQFIAYAYITDSILLGGGRNPNFVRRFAYESNWIIIDFVFRDMCFDYNRGRI